MSLKIAVQMDPIQRINVKGDSTFALLLEAQKRGHGLSYYTPDRLALLSGWRETDLFTPREQAALAWTEAVTNLDTGHIGDDLYAATAAEFPGRELAELTLAIIAINAWNRIAVPFHKKVTLSAKVREAA